MANKQIDPSIKLVDKPEVKFKMVGVDSNIFAVIGLWSQAARRAGWTADEIKKVRDAAMHAGEYHNALAVIITHSAEIGGPEEEEDEND